MANQTYPKFNQESELGLVKGKKKRRAAFAWLCAWGKLK